MNPNIEFSIKTAQAYSAVCKPLCQELGLPQTAFDILMFLANNPDYKTARDIVEMPHIKANLVSVNVDKLVQEGYLDALRGGGRPPQERSCSAPKRQRRSSRGAVRCRTLFRAPAGPCGPADPGGFFRTMEVIGKNLDDILKENA